MSRTQERILDAAESLFARQGISATSLRSITARAGVNTAAIHYHFGSKQALVSAILTRRIAPVSQQRIKRLEELEIRYRDEAIPAERLVEAFVVPLATVGEALRDEITRLGSLLAWLRVEGEGDGLLLAKPAIDVNQRFAEALCRRRSLGLDEARDRFRYATGAVVQFLGREPVHGNGTPIVEDLDMLRGQLSGLIRFLAAGLAAPAFAAIPISNPPQTGVASGVQGNCV